MGEAGYKKLIVWQKANDLAKEVYIATKCFPKEELFGVNSQLRRAALSVPLNIVEGYARRGKNELKYFLSIALGSLTEVEYLFDFSLEMGFLKKDLHQKLSELRSEVGKLLWGFYKSC